MLDVNSSKTRSGVRSYDPESYDKPARGGSPLEFGLFDVLQFLLRRKYLIIFALIAGFVVGNVILIFSTPVYQASTRVLIDTRHQDNALKSSDNTFLLDTSAIDSQVELIRSPVILSKVAATLKLHEVPDFNGTAKTPFQSFMDDIWSILGAPPAPPPVYSQEQGQRIATAVLQFGASANRVGRSYIIQISFRSTNREWTGRIANAIAEAYIEDQLDAKYSSTRRATVWLQERINELRSQATLAEREVERFKAANNIIDAGGGLLSNQQLTDAAGQWMAARAQTAEAKVRLDRVSEIFNSARNGMMPEATVVDINSNPIIARLRGSYLDALKRETDISSRFGRDHVAAVALRNEMKGLQETMLVELRRVVETLRGDYEIAQSREEGMRSAMQEFIKLQAVTGEAKIPLRELETTAQSYRALYDSFLSQQAQATQQITFPRTEARVINTAGTPWAPVEPNVNRTLLISLAIGGLAGIGLAFAREQLDRVFRTPAQVERVLGMECLGILPIIAGGTDGDINSRSGTTAPIDGEAEPALARRQLMRHVIDQPFSRFSETLRSIKVTLDLTGLARTSHTVGFVSSMPNEGKTTVSCNFASLVAMAGQPTILLDLDLRNPSLSRRLAPDAKVGLIEVMRGEVALADALRYEPETKLYFLPAVIQSRHANTSEVLASPQMSQLVKSLRERFQYVVVDLPPLAPVVDARASVNLIDNFLLVLEWGRSKYDVVIEALKTAPEIEEKTLGAVLNKTNIAALRRYDTHRESYYENKYYKRYGYEN
jgi:polysaccharide biosynthesis transport protein